MRMPASLRTLLVLSFAIFAWTGCGEDRFAPESGPGESATIEREMLAAPPGYYDSVDGTNATTMRTTLHSVIEDHTRYPYTSSATDTWDILESADENPSNSNRILDVYLNESYAKEGGGNTNYNREHTWPKSYGFPNDGSTNYPYTDCHHLFLCDSGYNSSRSNKPFRNCLSGCTEKPTVANNGAGGAGQSNWTAGSFSAGTWEVWEDRRGDIARAMFYMDVRYEGGSHGVTGHSEPDLILTNDENLIANSNTGSNGSVAYMGMLDVLLQWHAEDPVDAKESSRNDVIFSFQGNRNPFIDNPSYVDCIFENICGGGGDTTPPADPTGLIASGGDGSVNLDWADNSESDLSGYNVYRATSSGGPYSKINSGLAGTSDYLDSGLTNGTTYFYVVRAVDTSSNESQDSNESSATPQGGGSGPAIAWINEFHYDNASGDVGEFVEIAGGAGTSLSGWSVVAYNGNGGGSYQTLNLSGTLPDQSGGFGALSFAMSGIQNGSPDGLALVDDGGSVVEFLSYEGSFTATDGPANGMTSVDIGTSEPTNSPVGYSLQLIGTGSVAADFSWSAPSPESPGAINAGQSFGGGPPADTTPPAVPSGLLANAGDALVDLDWADNGESDLAGYRVYRATSSGGPYSQINSGLTSFSDFADGGVTNGTTYFYVVTAEDNDGNESAWSTEVSALPEAPAPPATVAWINEFHYDDKGRDSNEGVEVAGTAGTNLSGWTLVGYNGNGGGSYKTVSLSGTLPNQQNGFGTAFFSFKDLQNGGPDGFALVDDAGQVVEFLSYEGSFTASNGPASGMVSVDCGVFEDGSGSNKDSLQRVGSGNQASDFSWTGPTSKSQNSINSGQSFTAASLRVDLARN